MIVECLGLSLGEKNYEGEGGREEMLERLLLSLSDCSHHFHLHTKDCRMVAYLQIQKYIS